MHVLRKWMILLTNKLLFYCCLSATKKSVPLVRAGNIFGFISIPLLYSLIFGFFGLLQLSIPLPGIVEVLIAIIIAYLADRWVDYVLTDTLKLKIEKEAGTIKGLQRIITVVGLFVLIFFYFFVIYYWTVLDS